MVYSPTEWQNEVPSTTPLKYQIVDDTDGEIAASATIELVTPVTAGTAVNAANLNKIEQGIADAHDGIADLQRGNLFTLGNFTHSSWADDVKAAGEFTLNVADFGVPATAVAVLARIEAKWPSYSVNDYIRIGPEGGQPCAYARYVGDNRLSTAAALVPVVNGQIRVGVGANASGVTVAFAAYIPE